jgi:hypothetical protein
MVRSGSRSSGGTSVVGSIPARDATPGTPQQLGGRDQLSTAIYAKADRDALVDEPEQAPPLSREFEYLEQAKATRVTTEVALRVGASLTEVGQVLRHRGVGHPTPEYDTELVGPGAWASFAGSPGSCMCSDVMPHRPATQAPTGAAAARSLPCAATDVD